MDSSGGLLLVFFSKFSRRGEKMGLEYISWILISHEVVVFNLVSRSLYLRLDHFG